MTPKQIDHLKKKIADIKRQLAAEKRKFGAYDDSRGLRYLPTKYYIQLGDFTGGLTYTRWFAKNFPGDAGFPDFLFEWLLILFKTGKLREAEQKAVTVFCADIHLLDQFLSRPSSPPEPWEREELYSSSNDLAHVHQQPALTDFAPWLATLTASADFHRSASRFIELRRQLYSERDLAQRQALVTQLQQLAYPT